jgi:hypothetical protein
MHRIHRARASILAALCALAVGGCSSTSSPRSAAESFLSLLKDGQHLEAQDRLSADYKKMVVSLMGGIKNENLKPYYRSDSMDSFEILSVESSSESARVHVRIVTKDGSTHEDDIDLVREDGKWLVAHF